MRHYVDVKILCGDLQLQSPETEPQIVDFWLRHTLYYVNTNFCHLFIRVLA